MFAKLSELLVQFRRAVAEYNETAERYRELESHLLELINTALADGAVKVRTASDIRSLVDAITRMMESRAKLTSTLLQASTALKDIITAQAAAEAVLNATVAPTSLPSVKVAMLVEDEARCPDNSEVSNKEDGLNAKA